MPVDRAVLVERVFHVETHILPFAQADQRTGYGPVDADAMPLSAVDRQHLMRDLEADVLARHHCKVAGQAGRIALRPGWHPRR